MEIELASFSCGFVFQVWCSPGFLMTKNCCSGDARPTAASAPLGPGWAWSSSWYIAFQAGNPCRLILNCHSSVGISTCSEKMKHQTWSCRGKHRKTKFAITFVCNSGIIDQAFCEPTARFDKHSIVHWSFRGPNCSECDINISYPLDIQHRYEKITMFTR